MIATNDTVFIPGLCPQCGAVLVTRRAKKGPWPGSLFWGCSRYPECKTYVKPQGDTSSWGKSARRNGESHEVAVGQDDSTGDVSLLMSVVERVSEWPEHIMWTDAHNGDQWFLAKVDIVETGHLCALCRQHCAGAGENVCGQQMLYIGTQRRRQWLDGQPEATCLPTGIEVAVEGWICRCCAGHWLPTTDPTPEPTQQEASVDSSNADTALDAWGIAEPVSTAETTTTSKELTLVSPPAEPETLFTAERQTDTAPRMSPEVRTQRASQKKRWWGRTTTTPSQPTPKVQLVNGTVVTEAEAEELKRNMQ